MNNIVSKNVNNITIITIFSFFCFFSTATYLKAASSKITTTHTISILQASNFFTPDKLTINVGDTVLWMNLDSKLPSHLFMTDPDSSFYKHPIEVNEMKLVSILSGDIYKHTFKNIGIYNFYSIIYEKMRVKIIVLRKGQSLENMIKELKIPLS